MAGAKVIVGCKMPVPWFDMQLCEKRTVMENTQTGPREIPQFVRTGNVVRIRGTAYPRGTPPVGFPDKPQMVNGYALNQGIDKDFWDQWLDQNKKAPFVVSGMLVGAENIDALRGKTKDHIGELTGLEPVNPEKDPRMPASTIKGVAAVSTEEERAKTMAAA